MTRRALISRLLRHGLTTLCVLSLLACAGVAWIWRHSHSHGTDEGVVWEKWLRGPPPQRVEEWVVCSAGTIRFCHAVPGTPVDFSEVAAWHGARRISSGESIALEFNDVNGPGAPTVATRSVSPSGEISLPYLASQIRAAGRTPAELAVVVNDEYREANIINRAWVEVTTQWQPEDAAPPPSGGGTAAKYSSGFVRFSGSNSSSSPAGHSVSGGTYAPMYYSHWWTASPLAGGASAPLSISTPTPTTWAGFGLEAAQVQCPGFSGFSIAARCWLLCLVFAALPVLGLGRFCFRRRRHIAPNHCRKCGYDLTGNQSGKCPECGTPTAEIALA
jgi:hypothetical protein